MGFYYYLYPVGGNNHPLESECEGHFTSTAEAVEYLREMGLVTLSESQGGVGLRYEVTYDAGTKKERRQRWAIIKGPQKVFCAPDEADGSLPASAFNRV